MSDIPCYIFGLNSIGDDLYVMIGTETLEYGRAPIVKIAVRSLWTPSSIAFYPIVICQRKWSFPLAGKMAVD